MMYDLGHGWENLLKIFSCHAVSKKQTNFAYFITVAHGGLFRLNIVTSQEYETLVLWRHRGHLFLHV